MNTPAKPNPPKPAPPARPAPTSLKLAELERDPAINSRASGVSERVAADYGDAMRTGAKFPPVVVFRDATGKLWLADGFHRCHAVELAGAAEVLAEVREGDRRDAILFAAGCNAAHGQRRKRADVRRAIITLLSDAAWAKESDRWIAERCAVSPTTVGALRRTVQLDGSSPRKGKDGKVRRVPKRKTRGRKPNPARAVKAARRGLDGIVRGWPKGEPLGPLVEAVKAWLAGLEATP